MTTERTTRCRVPSIVVLAALVLLPAIRAQATWRPLPELTTRTGHAMAYDPVRERVVLFGGWQNWDLMADTWEWDGKRWELRRPPVSPPPRSGARIAFDPVRKTVLLFGGVSGNMLKRRRVYLDDTWEWDGRNWSQLKPTASPIRRSAHGMATDWARSRIVLFGGFAQVGPGVPSPLHQDTWEWDGKNWTQRFPRTLPPAGGVQGFAFNAKTKCITMFDGRGSSLSGIWDWDGRDWVRLSPKTSPPRWSIGLLVADPVTRGVLLYVGGDRTGMTKAATWHWDGQNWANLGQTLGSGYRGGFNLASDLGRRQVVLFGGRGPIKEGKFWPWQDTWTWDGKVWNKVHDMSFPEESVALVVHDGARDEFLVLQPSTNWTLPAKTWVMSNGVFRRLHPAISPPVHTSNAKAMLYHPGLKKVFYVHSYGQRNDIWLWDGKIWTQTSYQTGPDGRNVHLAWDGQPGRPLPGRTRTCWNNERFHGTPCRVHPVQCA